MADNFGIRRVGRVYEGGKFYSIPGGDVPANAIYMPLPSSSAQFGVAEYPVASGEKGAFAKIGTFAFPKPSGWTSTDGQTVYYIPAGQATGEIAAASATGAIELGFEVKVDGIPGDQIWVDING